MSGAIVSGSAGLVGASAVRCFASQGLDVIGVDNDNSRPMCVSISSHTP